MKRLKVLLAIMLASLMGIAITNGLAFERPENIALKDYKIGKGGSQTDDVILSEFSIPIYKIVASKRILTYKGAKISELIEGSEETFWFIMNKNEPEGIVVLNRDVPVKMGDSNCSKDLMKIYMSAKSSLEQGDELRYFELEGQGIFVVIHSNREDAYLSQSASQLLHMPADRKVNVQELISKIKEHIAEVQSQK